MDLKTDIAAGAAIAWLERRLPAIMARYEVPGLSIALVRDGELLWTRAFGYAHTGTWQPVTGDTRFEAASLSKPVCAYAALKLYERGLLALDKPLITYLPEEERAKPQLFDHILNEPRLGRITLRHVLSHTSGFPNWAPEGKLLRTFFEPGERFSYSGEGYVYLQQILAHITGNPPAAYMREQLLEPLGMNHSQFTWTEQEALPVAWGHDEEGKPLEKRVHAMNAAASLHTTAADFGRFMGAVMHPSPANPAHLHPDSVKLMLTPQIQVNDDLPWREGWPHPSYHVYDDLSWGLGWGIQHHGQANAFWHWGDNRGYKNFAIGFPGAGIGIALLTNSINGYRAWLPILQESLGGEYPAIEWLFSET